jgi:hypothetical protein
MRNVALAVGGALLITAGIVLAAFRPTSTGDTEGVIGPAVVVGSAAPAGSGTPGPSATPSTTVTPPTATPSRTPASPASDDHVHPVSPSPAVPVTDDHGGGRRSGRHGD